FGDFVKIKTRSYVKSDLVRSNNYKTGNAITFITPDQERTFVVYSGASIDLKRRDINLDDVKESRILHTEGYQIENSVFKDSMIYAMDFAKKNNVLVSMDVSDTGVISRNKEEMLRVIKTYVNVIFANEDEARTLTGKEKEDALTELGNWCEVAVIKLGKEGSLVRYRGKNYKIEGFKVNSIDSTGAGDMYAAGFLYGLSRGYETEICGYLGSYFAAKVVEKLGARLEFIDSEDVYKVLNREVINSEKIIKSY
ncbi:MAG: adenosine kinase, partial [Candidatus Nanoarchaeia archaeon]|nr:adenosine kinase [Candidatus Nanoarchaeia archaeon]